MESLASNSGSAGASSDTWGLGARDLEFAICDLNSAICNLKFGIGFAVSPSAVCLLPTAYCLLPTAYCCFVAPDVILNTVCGPGEVSEWLKEHAWKACSREIVTWVRIPPSPPPYAKAPGGTPPEALAQGGRPPEALA